MHTCGVPALSRTLRQKLWPSILWGARNTQDRRHTGYDVGFVWRQIACGCRVSGPRGACRVAHRRGIMPHGVRRLRGWEGQLGRDWGVGWGGQVLIWTQRTRTNGNAAARGRADPRYALSTRHTPLLQVCSPHISTLVTTHTSACLADVLMALCTIHLLLWRGPRDPAPFPHGAASHTRAGSVAHWALDLRWRLAALAGFAGGSRSFAARPSATASSASGSSATLAAYSRMKACRCSSASARSARA
jgi:hypothetical protein